MITLPLAQILVYTKLRIYLFCINIYIYIYIYIYNYWIRYWTLLYCIVLNIIVLLPVLTFYFKITHSFRSPFSLIIIAWKYLVNITSVLSLWLHYWKKFQQYQQCYTQKPTIIIYVCFDASTKHIIFTKHLDIWVVLCVYDNLFHNVSSRFDVPSSDISPSTLLIIIWCLLLIQSDLFSISTDFLTSLVMMYLDSVIVIVPSKFIVCPHFQCV